MDAWGRYGIHVRGCTSTTFGFLERSAELTREFKTFMSLCTTQPDTWGSYVQHMQPLLHFGPKHDHMAFMNRINAFPQDSMDVDV